MGSTVFYGGWRIVLFCSSDAAVSASFAFRPFRYVFLGVLITTVQLGVSDGATTELIAALRLRVRGSIMSWDDAGRSCSKSGTRTGVPVGPEGGVLAPRVLGTADSRGVSAGSGHSVAMLP